MNIDVYVDSIRDQLESTAAAAGEDALTLAQRLVDPLEAAVRLALLDALSAAAEEITLEMAPGSVELRLRGREPGFVVSLPPAEPTVAAEGPVWDEQVREDPLDRRDGREAGVWRINLRLPDRMKPKVEEAAGSEGLSLNAWLVRATAFALEQRDPARRRESRSWQGAQRYTGWAR